MNMPNPYLLLHSPLVGASSLVPTAQSLRARGLDCHIPALSSFGSEMPPWRDLPGRLLEIIPPLEAPVVVGHSAAGLLAARLAPGLKAAALIFLDARIAPGEGATPPVDEAFRKFLNRLPSDHGRLPPWSMWWNRDIFADVQIDRSLRSSFEGEQPRLPITWFDDRFPMTDWSAQHAGYLQTSALYVEEADEAARRGWPVARIDGTHLHPFLEPQATADALIALAAKCVETFR
jgi:hypothetical protein